MNGYNLLPNPNHWIVPVQPSRAPEATGSRPNAAQYGNRYVNTSNNCDRNIGCPLNVYNGDLRNEAASAASASAAASAPDALEYVAEDEVVNNATVFTLFRPARQSRIGESEPSFPARELAYIPLTSVARASATNTNKFSQNERSEKKNNDGDDDYLRQHVDKLMNVGVLTWDSLCRDTPSYGGDAPLTEAEIAFEDVIAAGLPLRKSDAVFASNGRCYSGDGLARWARTYTHRTVRPQFPDTKADMTRADLTLLDFAPDEIDNLLGTNRDSLESLFRKADRGERQAREGLRREQHAVAAAADAPLFPTAPVRLPPVAPSQFYNEPWFVAARERPGQVSWLLRSKPIGSFLVVWDPQSNARGTLAFVARDAASPTGRSVRRVPLARDAQSTGYYRTVELPPDFGSASDSNSAAVPPASSSSSLFSPRSTAEEFDVARKTNGGAGSTARGRGEGNEYFQTSPPDRHFSAGSAGGQISIPSAGRTTAATGTSPRTSPRNSERYVSLLHLLMARRDLHWAPDSPPVRGWKNITASAAEKLLAPQFPGSYIVRPDNADGGSGPESGSGSRSGSSSGDRHGRLFVSFRDYRHNVHVPVRIHAGPRVFGFSGPDDERGFATLEDYFASVEPFEESGALPTHPL